MVNITILGWYGTETIGDRAILAGLFRIFGECFDSFSIKIGSLFPFLTDRTLLEDEPFYRSISGNKMKDVSVFPCLSVGSLKHNINSSNYVFFGGGPITDISYLYAIEYGFKYAKNKKKKTGLIGCGLGPFYKKEYHDCLFRLIKMSDVIILRDTVSNAFLPTKQSSINVVYSVDPAVFAADYYSQKMVADNSLKYTVFNFRDISVVNTALTNDKYTDFFINSIRNELDNGAESVLLVPMHTFSVGGDDRYYLNRISRFVNDSKVVVQNEPLSLAETMSKYQNAAFCYGMRFHSVLLQTILNGRNCVFDYTNKKTGKTIGLLQGLGVFDTLEKYDRYMSLSDEKLRVLHPDRTFKVNISHEHVVRFMSKYVNAINSIK